MANPIKQLGTQTKHRKDNDSNPSSFLIPPYAASARAWLGKVEQEERYKTQRLLETLGPAPLGGGEPGQDEVAARPSKQFVPMGDATQGWTYVTTRTAGERQTPLSQDRPSLARQRPATAQQHSSAPLPVGTEGLEGRRAMAAMKHVGRQRAKDKDMEDALAAINQVHHRPHSAPITHHRELHNLLNSTAKRKADLAKKAEQDPNATGLLPQHRQQQEKSPEATTYQMSYQLAQDYPELYSQAINTTKSKPVPNRTFVSDWGDSLKQADDKEWRKDFFHSEYTMTNAQVHPPRSMTDEAKEHAFYKWMARQQLYYKDLLKDSAKPYLETLLGDGPLEPKREAVQVLRQLMAVVQPEMYKSHSQAVHCPMGRSEEPELTAMTKERTKRLTMGAPVPRVTQDMYPTVESKMREKAAREGKTLPGTQPDTQQARPASTGGMRDHERRGFEGSASMSRSLPQRGAASARKPAPKDYNKSTIPIKWAVNSGPISSSYIDAFGSPGVEGGGRISGQKPVRYKEVTCPIGAVNPHTAIAPFRKAYPVPECYVTPKDFPAPHGDATMLTTSRDAFQPQSSETMARVLASQAEANKQSRAALLRSELPLGTKKGFVTASSKDWVSEYDGEYKGEKKADIKRDYDAAQRYKQILAGPTASAGRLTMTARPIGQLGSPSSHHRPPPVPAASA